MTTTSEIQAAQSARARGERERAFFERRKWEGLLSAILAAKAWADERPEERGDYALPMSGDHRPRPILPPPPRLTERIRTGLDAPRGTVDLKELLREALEELEAAEERYSWM